MCGICGITFKNKQRLVDASLVKAMNDTLMHRGPDDQGLFIQQNTGLGHRRLSIIDLSGGHQPIFNEDRSICIVFNGEIYNHESLRAELLKKGHIYYTKSDTETIIHAYEEYGCRCLQYLRGMFAFAIYDMRKKLLFLARDRVGKKPMYYYKDDTTFIFASEIKAILKSGLVKKEINPAMLDFYLSLGYVPGSQSLFKNILKLEAGNYLLLDDNHNIEAKEYWDIRNIQINDIPYKDACFRLKEKLIESLSLRLMSEVPLGVFLSGGLDSSSIVALMSEIVTEPIKTFSVGYKNEPRSSELHYAKIIAERFKTEHHEFYLTADDLFDSIEGFLEHSEEPIVESAAIALFKLAKLAKPEATVLLSGEGADEGLAGYQVYQKMMTMERIYSLVRMLPSGFYNGLLNLNGKNEKISKYLDLVRLPFKSRYRSVSFDVSESIRDRMYSPGFRDSLSDAFETYFYSLHDSVAGRSTLRKMLYIDTKSWLPEDILLKSDRMTMAASVEMRCPFLDHEFIELATSLPDSFKLNNGNGKYILKDIARGFLPKEIIFRQKKGFPVPLSSWFKANLQQRAYALLTDKRTLARGYLNPEYLRGLFNRIKKGEDLGKRIFSLVTLELWFRKYID